VSTIVQTAATFAANAHRGQYRKYTGEPYILHPMRVAGLVSAVGMPEWVEAAAWLHDVIEDCGVTRDDIIAAYRGEGWDIAQAVHYLTDQPSNESRAVRKADTAARLSVCSSAVQTIKLADLIDNTDSIVDHDPKFAALYLREKEALLDVLTRGHPVLWQMAHHQLCAGLSKLDQAA